MLAGQYDRRHSQLTRGRSKVRVYFFEVETDGADFMSIVGEVSKLRGTRKTAAVLTNGGEARLERVLPLGHQVAGDLVRIRMKDIPAKIRRAGGTTDINLDPDQGIGEETAFVYDSKLNTLALQSNRSGVSAPALSAYFTRLNSSNAEVWLDPVVDLSGLQDLRELASATTLEVAVTADSEIESLEPPATLGAMIEASNELEAPKLQLTVTVGHGWRSQSLNLQKLREWARFLLREGKESVTNLRISGRDADGEATHLDMLRGRLKYDGVPATRSRRATFRGRVDVLQAGIEHHRKQGKLISEF